MRLAHLIQPYAKGLIWRHKSTVTIGAAFTRRYSSSNDSGKIQVEDNLSLHWEKHGTGPNTVLCCPGLLGTVETNYGPLFQRADLEKFTFIGIDPIGHGKSRPPDQESLPEEFFAERDARHAAKLMESLGCNSYSVLGWSSGGLTAMALGLNCPNAIQKAVICNAPFKITSRSKNGIEKVSNLRTWPTRVKKGVMDKFGQDYAEKLLSDWRQFMNNELAQPNHLPRFCAKITEVNFQTLLVYGTQDALMDTLSLMGVFKGVKTYRVYPITKGSHFHLEFMDEFTKATLKFLDA